MSNHHIRFNFLDELTSLSSSKHLEDGETSTHAQYSSFHLHQQRTASTLTCSTSSDEEDVNNMDCESLPFSDTENVTSFPSSSYLQAYFYFQQRYRNVAKNLRREHLYQPRMALPGWFGVCAIVIGGCILGILMPKNISLPTHWYQTVSSILGYTYFLFWSGSFYPQIISNWRRKSTVGLSNDFAVSNILGYICYTLYTAEFYWNDSIQKLYSMRHQGKHPSEELLSISLNNPSTDPIMDEVPMIVMTVQSNDVAFAIHALIMSIICVIQIYIYDGFQQRQDPKYNTFSMFDYMPRWLSLPISFPLFLFMVFIILWSSLYAIAIVWHHITMSSSDIHNLSASLNSRWNWLDFLYMLSFFKVIISTIKYIPQVLLNAHRKSTDGWNVWNIIFDLAGGILSCLQLILDAFELGDFSGITGNLAKLGLSFVTIFFDIIFLIQHYVLYPDNQDVDTSCSCSSFVMNERRLCV